MKRVPLALVTLFALVALPVFAGEWHASTTNLCTDCHTMHFSQTHNWDGSSPVSTTPQPGGNWLSTTGPNDFLLKAPANQLCLACHDGQTFAPDVLADNFNAAPTQGRSAGALNEPGVAAGYEIYKGHTLDSTQAPPGYNPAAVGLGATTYNPANGLECTSCHTQHGMAAVYRNLGPRGLGDPSSATGLKALPSYVISTTNDSTKDVWINIASQTGTVGSRTAAEFNPFYDTASVNYNRNDKTVGTTLTSNGIDTQCAACHGNFHGGPGNTEIGGTATVFSDFIRHPTSATTIGTQGSGHSTLTRYTAAVTKVKTYSDAAGYTDASPGCITCHKAHGNKNPFGLVFLSRNAASVGEEGGYGAAQTPNQMVGYRNLCGQCHGQGSDGTLN
jgi:cytochrome c553